jgi:DNA-binding NtrC family response regulator
VLSYVFNYFLQKYADKNQKRVRSISREAMEALCAYSYPGNVRELENS